MGSQSFHSADRGVYSGQVERCGGSTQSFRAGLAHGMDYFPPDSPGVVASLGEATHRLVCHSVLGSASSLHLSGKRSSGLARNAFSLSWTGMSAYAYPPTSLIPRVIAKFKSDRPRLILITPGWPQKPWFPDLLSLSHVPPLPLALDDTTLVQPRSGVGHGCAHVLALTAWLLCGPDCEHKA